MNEYMWPLFNNVDIHLLAAKHKQVKWTSKTGCDDAHCLIISKRNA